MKRTSLLGQSCLFTIGACVALILLPRQAHAQRQLFTIEAGDLQSALDAYSVATGTEVRVEGVEIDGLKTSGVNGEMNKTAALRRILSGNKLQQCGAERVRIVIVAPATRCVESEASEGHGVASDIIVTANAVSHLAAHTRTGTRMDADPLTLPLSVSTVSESLLARQQSLTLADAAANISGVTPGGSGSFNMRGFSAGVQRNGDLGLDGTSSDLPNLAIARLEVVKGPAAIIAGVASSYGGLVNIITKTPQDSFLAEIVGTVGSRGYYDAGIDVGGPLNEDKSVLFRMVATTQNTDHTINGYDGPSNDYLAPSMTWRNKDWGTEITAQFEYQDVRRAPDILVFTDQPKLTGDLKTLRLGAASDGIRTKIKRTTLQINQDIVPGWTMTARYAGERRNQQTNSAVSFPGSFLGLPFSNIVSIANRGDTKVAADLFKFELRGHFATGPVKHSLLLAYDNQKTKIAAGSQSLSVSSTDIQTGEVTDLDDTLGVLLGLPGPRTEGGLRPRETGLLALDQMQWGDLYVLAGYRRMVYTPHLSLGDVGTFKKGLPSLGVLYRLTPEFSFYASASKGFTPNLGQFSIDGSAVSPEQAKQYEGGAKALLFNKQIAATLSVYRIDQKNVAADDPTQPNPVCLGGSACFITIPGVRSTGAELEISGTLFKHFEVRASYAYADKKAPAIDGASANLSGIAYAHHIGSLWTTYNFRTDNLGFWLGSGIQARSARNNDSDANVINPGQIRVDLSGGYQAKAWQVIFGVKNVTNKRLYDVGSGYSNIGTVTQPREVYATLRYRFN
ncbi:TonB-dependent siderophore receptor [Sphingobium lactosutens]|uniref:TonB-dependent siderophore receptor n=1 Tax=Sphingobium lactosutens TaxID=522773 RepID=UPI0015BEF4F9|nr:TonB-dependent receptor [Sphingobium lactosutens]